MLIRFDLGLQAGIPCNQIMLDEIYSDSDLALIRALTQQSTLKIRAIREQSTQVTSDEGRYRYKTLVIDLPDLDENAQPYSSFKYLFNHPTYVDWKKRVLSNFPDLMAHVSTAENRARMKQEMSDLKNEVKAAKEAASSASFFSAQDIPEKQAQIHALGEKLYRIYTPGGNYTLDYTPSGQYKISKKI